MSPSSMLSERWQLCLWCALQGHTSPLDQIAKIILEEQKFTNEWKTSEDPRFMRRGCAKFAQSVTVASSGQRKYKKMSEYFVNKMGCGWATVTICCWISDLSHIPITILWSLAMSETGQPFVLLIQGPVEAASHVNQWSLGGLESLPLGKMANYVLTIKPKKVTALYFCKKPWHE